jgi:hypothetical protein
VHNQHGELILEGEHKYLLKKRNPECDKHDSQCLDQEKTSPLM